MPILADAIRVLVADEHPIFIAGLRALLEESGDIDVVAQATSPIQAVRLALQTRPDVAIVDASIADLSIVEQLSAEAPDIKVICLSACVDGSRVRQAIAAGARAYVLKQSSERQLVIAIEAVSRGGIYMDAAIADRFASTRAVAALPGRASSRIRRGLTDRERDVLRLIALGFTNKEVAVKLGVTAKSVETYKTRASMKIDVHTRSRIVQYAILQGWFDNTSS